MTVIKQCPECEFGDLTTEVTTFNGGMVVKYLECKRCGYKVNVHDGRR